jgi:hypothetical protein
MRFVSTIAAVTCALTLSAAPLVAQGRGNGQAKKAAQTTKAPKTTGSATQTAKATTKADSTAAKTAARAETRAAKAETRAAKAETKAAKKAGTTTTTPTTVDVTPTTPTTTHVKNPKLEARLLAMLPPGSNIVDASAGFKNWGQFVAATHVSTNLGIPFADLKAAMTGIPVGTPPGTVPTVTTTPLSLGQAVQTLKGTATTAPTGDPLTTTQINQEVKKAEDAANADLRQTRGRS